MIDTDLDTEEPSTDDWPQDNMQVPPSQFRVRREEAGNCDCGYNTPQFRIYYAVADMAGLTAQFPTVCNICVTVEFF
jgi:hypothetical protein